MRAAFSGFRKFEKQSLKSMKIQLTRMDVSSDEDEDEEIEDHEKIKSASDALQVMDKVIRFSYQLDNEKLCEPIKSARPQSLEKTPDKNNKTLFTKN